MSAVSFNYSVSSESGWDKLTITVKGTTIANAISGSSSSSWSGSLSKGDVISLIYSKDGSASSGNDCGTLSNISITTSVKTQIDSELKEVARKIKKAYIGIGDIARPFWAGGELTYYGIITSLSTGRYELAATSIGNYGLFGGGWSASTVVDYYTSSLTKGTATALSRARFGLAAASTTAHAIFGGGNTDGSTYSNVVDAYNTSLTRTVPTAFSSVKGSLSAAKVGNYVLFSGGDSGTVTTTSSVDAYNLSLTRSNPTAQSSARSGMAAASIGNYAIFAGGNDVYGRNEATVDAYNTSLTRSTPTSLNIARHSFKTATSVGDYALIAGGIIWPGGGAVTAYDKVDVYNKSLTHSMATSLSVARGGLAATTLGDYALFAGGETSSSYSAVVDAYDPSLVRTIPTPLNMTKQSLSATTIGDYALFGGGYLPSYNVTSEVEAYVLA